MCIRDRNIHNNVPLGQVMATEMVEQFLYSRVYLREKEWRCNLKEEAPLLIVVVQMAELSYDRVFVNFLRRS